MAVLVVIPFCVKGDFQSEKNFQRCDFVVRVNVFDV